MASGRAATGSRGAAAVGGAGAAAPHTLGTLRTKRSDRETLERLDAIGTPPLDANAITLVGTLLQLPRPPRSLLLHKLLLHCCSHSESRQQIVSMLLAQVGTEDDGRGAAISASAAKKRALEALNYIARKHHRVPSLLLTCRVAVAPSKNDKGKGKAKEEIPALRLLFELTSHQLFVRSSSHAEQLLQLLENVSRAMATHKSLPPLPDGALDELASMLARNGLADTSYARTTTVIRNLLLAYPAQQSRLAASLERLCVSLGAEAANELSQGLPSRAAAVAVLRIMKTIRSILEKDPNPQEKILNHLLDLNGKLRMLWEALGTRIGKVEDEMGDETGLSSLLPKIPQALPLIEAYFLFGAVVANVSSAISPKEEPLQRAPSLPRVASLPRSGSARESLGGLQSSADEPTDPASLVQSEMTAFAHAHKRMLNALIQRTPHLLSQAFEPLLRLRGVVNFNNKRTHFQTRMRKLSMRPGQRPSSLRLNIRRQHVLQDSYHQLHLRTPQEMRGRMAVTFTGEEGVDAGGVTREWYSVLMRSLLDVNFSLFESSTDGTYQPSPNSAVNPDHLSFLRFAGLVVGKALCDGHLLECHFTRSLMKHLLGLPVSLDDVERFDQDLHKNLLWSLKNSIEGVLDLNFTAETDYFGSTSVVDLKPGGADIQVTDDNKADYVNLVAAHKLTHAIKDQLAAFQGGFHDMVPMEELNIFDEGELELMLCGLPEIDVEDWRRNSEYSGGYSAASQQIVWFWEAVGEMCQEDLARLLQFCTATSRVPLGGFSQLRGVSGPQKFSIAKALGDDNRLPASHTCFHSIDLPVYSSKEILRERLMFAITEGTQGFGFS